MVGKLPFDVTKLIADSMGKSLPIFHDHFMFSEDLYIYPKEKI